MRKIIQLKSRGIGHKRVEVKSQKLGQLVAVLAVLLMASVSLGAKNHLVIERGIDSIEAGFDTIDADKESRIIQSKELEVILKLLELSTGERSEVLDEFIQSGRLKIKEAKVNWEELKIVYRTLSDFQRFRTTRDQLSISTSTVESLKYYIENQALSVDTAKALLSFTLEAKVKGSSVIQPYLTLRFFEIKGVDQAVQENLKNSDFTSSLGIRPENEENLFSLEGHRNKGTPSWTIDKATAYNILRTYRAQTEWTSNIKLVRIFSYVNNWNPDFKIKDRSQFASLAPGGYISPKYLSKLVYSDEKRTDSDFAKAIR